MSSHKRVLWHPQTMTLFVLLCLGLFMPLAQGQQNLIYNGSFEIDAHPGGVGYNHNPPIGWGGTGQHVINSINDPFHAGSGPIPHGSQVYGCQGSGVINQIVGGLAHGTACSFSFHYNLRIGNPGMNLTVLLGNHTLFNTALITHTASYVPFTLNFNYDLSWGNDLQFIFQNPGGDNTLLLDDVRLVAVPTYRTVTASVSGGHGTISPSGVNQVLYNGRPVFTLTPDPGYRVSTIRINGVLQQEMGIHYAMPNVLVDSTLEVTFGLPDWTFDVDGYLDGWTPKDYIAPGSTVADGSLVYNIVQNATDPMWYSQPLSLPTAAFRWMRVITKNGTSAHIGRVYWYGDSMTNFDELFALPFDIFRNDGSFTEYWVDLNSSPAWGALTTATQFRLDLPDASDYALSEHGTQIEIDRITLLPANQGPPAPGFTSIKRHTPDSDAYMNVEGVIWKMRFNQPFTPDVSDVDAVTTGTVVAGPFYGFISMNSLSLGLGYEVSGEGTIKMVGTGTGSGTSNLTGLSMETPFNDGEVFYIDTVGPTVVIGAPSKAVTAGGSVTFPVTYNDGGSGVDTVSLGAGDVTLIPTGTATGTVSVSGSGATRTVTISNITGDGKLAISIAEETAVDVVGNLASASEVSASFDVDNAKPILNVGGQPSVNLECGDPYTAPAATANDNRDGNLTAQIQVTGSVDNQVPDTYVLSYSVSDTAGNTATVTREVIVADSLKPEIGIVEDNPANVILGSAYTDAGATATDKCDGDLTDDIVTTGSVNPNAVGTYFMYYNVTDSAGFAADEAIRQVNVIDLSVPNVVSVDVVDGLTVNVVYSKDMTGATGLLDTATYTLSGSGQGTLSAQPAAVSAVDGTTVQLSWPASQEMFNGGAIRITVDAALKDIHGEAIVNTVAESSAGGVGVAPVITMNAADETLDCGVDSFANPAASALDNVDGAVAVVVDGDDAVDMAVPGVYTITYTASDAAGNTATASRVVTVADLSAPVIALEGDATVELACGDSYEELGATASDACEGDLSNAVVIGGDVVDTTVADVYVVTYDVADSGERAAVQVTRTVTVVDNDAPDFTLNGDAAVEIECGEAYEELGATAVDVCDGDLSGAVTIGGDAVDTSVAGESFVVTYDVSDAAGNAAAQLTRTVTVVDNTGPAITVLGDNPLVLDFGNFYEEFGATALDSCDGDVSASVQIDASNVNDRAVGVYVVSYTAVDESGNVSVAERVVDVRRDACKLLFDVTATPNPVVPGETLTFSATETAENCSVGEVTIQWEKRGADKADWMAVGDGPVFVIDSVDFDDAGDYRCSLSDDMITDNSAVVTIVVGTGMPVAGIAGLAVALALAAAGGVALRKRD